MPDLRLVIFDVDGTLVDSQAEIMAAMKQAFASEGLPMLDRPCCRSLGCRWLRHLPCFAPSAELAQQTRVVQAYKDAFNDSRGLDGQAELSTVRLLRCEHCTHKTIPCSRLRLANRNAVWIR